MVSERNAVSKGIDSPVTGYRLLLPSEWVQVPLLQGTIETVDRVLRDMFSLLPADAPRDRIEPYKAEISRRFRESVVEAQRRGGLDLYVPLKLRGDQEFNLGASILVAETTLPKRPREAPPADPGELAVQLLSRDGEDIDVASGEVDGSVAVRREYVAEAERQHVIQAASRRVEYVISVPGDGTRWFVAAFSTIGGGSPRDELADVLVEWFDAVMATFRWRHA
ncbi:hypothetical protein [Streptomyces pseudogriseolus]|uniref:hypothetical protein n=1 Tax=Streptomyces pseudogriseolus TaxID=36817 RepID=UPI003FA218E0